MTKHVIYLDLDDTIVDFNSSPRIPTEEKHLYNHPKMYEAGFFNELKPFEGAVEAVQELIKDPFWDVYILTQPVAKSPNSYKEKVEWVMEHLPDLTYKIIMTQNKLLHKGSVLVDDSIKWKEFPGHFIQFQPRVTCTKAEWERVSKELIRFKRAKILEDDDNLLWG